MPRPSFFRLFTNSVSRNDLFLKKAAGFTYTIDWSFNDYQFAARCPAFPDIVCLGGTREQALEEAKHKVAAILAGPGAGEFKTAGPYQT